MARSVREMIREVLAEEAAEALAQKTSSGERKRGRRPGYILPTFAEFEELTLEDFAFLRTAVGGGVSLKDAFARYYGNLYFDAEGNPLKPDERRIKSITRVVETRMIEIAGASDDAAVRREAEILALPLPDDAATEPQRVAAHMDFNEWATTQPEDFFSERELIEKYQEYLDERMAEGADKVEIKASARVISRASALEDKIRAISRLQTELALAPSPASPVERWFAQRLSAEFKAKGLADLGALIAWIQGRGRHWHRDVPGLGAGRAARLLGWLQDHQETLPALDTTLPQWKPKAPLRAALKPLAPSPALPVLASDEVGGVATVQGPELRLRLAPAPLELLLVPDELDGRDGLFRADGVNVLNAGNDLHAIAGFLARFASSDKLRTLEAYRREVERFYSWCLSVREVALSSVTQADALAYQAFLANIPASWIHHKPTTRDAVDWTPFRGQLHPRSQNYALGVVKSLFSYLWKIGYLRADAFDGLLPRNDGKVATPMDTTRALHPLDLEEVARAIEVMKARTFKNKEGQTEGVSSREAISHRNQFLVHLALTTGMRLAEIASASLATARHAIVDDVETDTIVIEIVGKGERKREVTLIPSAMTMLQEHHRHVAELLKEHPARLEAFQRSLPLVVALEAAVASPSRAISDDGAMLAHDDCGLSRAGILAVVKRFFAQVAKGCDDHARKERLAKVSTHWLRHSFAHEALRCDNTDTGLKLTQQLLGHKNINTTAGYLQQNQSERVKAALKINPLGL